MRLLKWLGVAVLMIAFTAALAAAFGTMSGRRTTTPAAPLAAVTPTASTPPTAVPPVKPGPLTVVGKEVLFEDPELFFMDWSPDGQTLLLGKETPVATERVLDPDTKSYSAFFIFQLWKYSLENRSLTKLLDNVDKAYWSPDGSQIFYSTVAPNSRTMDIYLMAADGSSRTKLLTADATRQGFTLSKNGALAFRRGTAIYTRTAADGQERQWPKVTLEPAVQSDQYRVAPDGSAVVVISKRGLELIKQDGSRTDLLKESLSPSAGAMVYWSSDSKKLLYARGRPSGSQTLKAELLVMDVAGAVARSILSTSDGREEFFPRWSHAGERIFFYRQFWRSETEPPTLWVINSDGSGPQKLGDRLVPLAAAPSGQKLLVYESGAYIAGKGTSKVFSLLTLQ